MPYRSNRELPPAVRNALPTEAQDVFLNVVNSELERGRSDARAFAGAWSTLRRQGWRPGEGGKKWYKVEKWRADFAVSKVDELKKQVFGFASVIEDENGAPLVDLQGDIIEEDELEKAVYDYVLESRDASLMHEEMGKAVLIESFVITKQKRDMLKLDSLPLGWWVGYQVLDDDVFRKVLSGDLKMFSIGGTAEKIPLTDSEG